MDLLLLVQYYHYRSDKTTMPLYGYTRVRTPSAIGRHLSVGDYRTLSAVAANVAASAGIAAQQDAQDSQYARTRPPRRSADQLFRERSGSQISRDVLDNESEVDEAALSALGDSFHSEGGRSNRRKRVSWSNERGGRGGSLGRVPNSPIPNSLQITSQRADDSGMLSRGRPIQRNGESDIEEAANQCNSETAHTHRTSSRASRRGASMVFLGVWALFSFGTLAGSRSGIASDGIANIGRVLNNKTTAAPIAATTVSTALTTVAPLLETIPLSIILNDGDLPPVEPSRDRILGRVFAWLCTTLYLTSRLPQIWKNFVRKSVDGLSMYLFVFAFFGNTFYVISILTAPEVRMPPPTNRAFIRESIPYLLGSAGTLLFDISIVGQSLIYRRQPLRHRGRRGSTRRRAVAEETGLLSADALAGQSDTLSRSKSRTSSS